MIIVILFSEVAMHLRIIDKLEEEKKELERELEFKQSVIMDLEEDLRRNNNGE